MVTRSVAVELSKFILPPEPPSAFTLSDFPPFAPLDFPPRLEFVFFGVSRTVSRDIDFCKSQLHHLARQKTQCPVGMSYGLNATALTCASCLASSLRGCLRRRRSLSASKRPSSTSLLRVRNTVMADVSTAFALCASLPPSVALSNICALLIFRADVFPRRVTSNAYSCSPSLKFTVHLIFDISSVASCVESHSDYNNSYTSPNLCGLSTRSVVGLSVSLIRLLTRREVDPPFVRVTKPSRYRPIPNVLYPTCPNGPAGDVPHPPLRL